MRANSILLSIKPVYAHKIFTGKKTVELRKKLPKDMQKGDLVIVYISSPQKNIYGAFTVKKIIVLPINKLWNKVYKKAGINKNDFFEYFYLQEYGYGIVIDNYWRFPEPIKLQELKYHDDTFNIPQSYRYLKDSDYELIQTEFGILLGT